MASHLRPSSGDSPPPLPDALAALARGTGRPADARIVVAACYRMAMAVLRTAVTNRELQGLSLEDQAMDAIAELFERTPAGRFPVLEAYFEDGPEALQQLTPTAAVQRLRPLVQGAITDRLFESNGEADASLARIIRSVKRAVQPRDDAALERTMGALHVALSSDGALDGTQAARPTISHERLAARLARSVRTGAQIPDLVDAAIQLLTDHPLYAPQAPVTLIALAIRTATVEVGQKSAPVGRRRVLPRALRRLSSRDIEEALDAAVRQVREAKRASYVTPEKCSAGTYAAYLDATAMYMAARYLPPTDPALTQHEALRSHLPHVSRAKYRAEHRSTFEYLVRAVRHAVEAELQDRFDALKAVDEDSEVDPGNSSSARAS